jgi:hypothetical protein
MMMQRNWSLGVAQLPAIVLKGSPSNIYELKTHKTFLWIGISLLLPAQQSKG